MSVKNLKWHGLKLEPQDIASTQSTLVQALRIPSSSHGASSISFSRFAPLAALVAVLRWLLPLLSVVRLVPLVVHTLLVRI